MRPNHGTDAPVVALVDDLYFMAIISSAAQKAGVEVTFLRTGEEVPSDVRVALVDLQTRLDWQQMTEAYIASGGSVVAFGPHLEPELLKAARAAGCRRVMAKSKFVTEVGRILSGAASPRNAETSESRHA